MGAWVIGIILVGVAAFSIVGVMVVVLREHQEHEEWYDPSAPENQPKPDAQTPAHEGE